MQHIEIGIKNIQERIKKAMDLAERDSINDDVKLVAVSKFHTAQAVQCATRCGQWDFGESYVQEALIKQEELSVNDVLHRINWHFVGHIQSRKAKDIVGRFALLHSVDSEKLALLLNKHAQQLNIKQSILIQVNIGSEDQKSGVDVKNLRNLTQSILQCPYLELQGLMCLPPVFDQGLAARPYFAHLRNLKEDLSQYFGINLPHLSMGMSGDLEAAILEGASLVRIGTDIFGARSA